MRYLLKREDKSDGSHDYTLEIHLEKKDTRKLFKKRQRFTISIQDIEAEEDVPIHLTEVVITGTTKKRRKRPGKKKISNRHGSQSAKTEGDTTGEGLPEQAEEKET